MARNTGQAERQPRDRSIRKVWKVTWSGPDGVYVEWCPSKTVATRRSTERCEEESDFQFMAIRRVEIPIWGGTDGLVGWLNRNCSMDNG